MKNSKVAPRGPRSQKLWLPSLLLLAQFLTIAPVLLIVFADEQQKKASDGYVTLLDGLDQLSFAIADLENIPRPAVKQAGADWRQKYSDYRDQSNRILSVPPAPPEVRDSLARVDSIVARMAATESELAGANKRPEQTEALAASFQQDGRAARIALLTAQRSVRSELSTTGNSITEKTTYLKALVAGACLLAFGVVFVVRRFRVDAAIQRKLQNELRTTNDEVIAALAAARSESEVKNQFLAHVGHLIRTPLHAIAGGIGELLQMDLTGRQRDSAQASLGLAESLSKVADQVVDYSRMESGTFELKSSEFEPARLVTDMVQLFIASAERKGLRLRSSIEKDLPSLVKGDPERLRQVLGNLLSNAIRFTQQGDISLRVEEASSAEERTTLRFEVKDTGIGITEQVRSRIFQPFGVFQTVNPADGQIAGGSQGTGLGLPISKKLVELMGGKIQVSGEPGRGAAFSFTAAFENVRASAAPLPESSQSIAFATDIAAAGARPPVSAGTRNGKKVRDRRTEHRHGINYPTLLRAESAGIAVIRVLDVSASGLRVSVPFRLIPRTEVEIRIEGTSVIGIVRNCTCIAANEFHIGIQIPREASADEQERLNHLRLLRIMRVVPIDQELAEEGAG
jgi:signal transduction histidine kinase